MGYLFKILSIVIPKSLISRFTLIICIPMFVCQMLTVYIFYERHWDNVTEQTSKVISTQIRLALDEYSKGDLTKVVKYSKSFNFRFEIVKSFEINQTKFPRMEVETLMEILRANIPEFVDIEYDRENSRIITYYKIGNKQKLKISIPSKPLINPTSEIFVLWVVGTSFIFVIIALIFAKNQIRSIEELSIAANRFGKGEMLEINFKPSGALEIRQAGLALIKMKERIRKQVKKRLQMLAMISHDLRTPLTRMLLQLELMDETKEVTYLKNDAESMKHMIDSYLDFARGEGSEKFELVNVKNWLEEVFERSRFQNTKLITNNLDAKINIKPLSFMRAITNIISNAEKYSKNSEVSYHFENSNIFIEIEDDGPGIKDEEKELVMKAFYRSDKARSIDAHGSVGLGLPIAKEIILSHKGTITIGDSKKLGGTMVVIKIPVAEEGSQ